MRRCALIVTLAVSLAGLSCAQAATAPRVVTLRDSGQRLTVHRGAELQLRLAERYRWLAPRVRGTSVRLTRIDFVRDPGYLAWAVSARSRGASVVTALGYAKSMQRSCDPGPCSPRLLRVTFVVR